MNTFKSVDSREMTEIILITGFLGAGKTTLLKKMLSWETDLSDTVVIVNEFGDIGIDGYLLENAGSEVIELASGCICCSLKVNLAMTLNHVWSQFKPRQILVESTGVADPAGVLEVLQENELIHRMKLSNIVTVLDCELWEAREWIGPVFFNQLRMAHTILLNKVDVLDEQRIPEILEEIHEMFPGCRVVPTIHCGVDPEILGRPDPHVGPEPIGVLLPAADLFGHGGTRLPADSLFVSFSFQDTRVFDEIRFKRFVDQLPWELFRMKGIVRFSDRTVMVNHVGGNSQWTDWREEKETRIAFVGWKIDGDDTVQKLESCLSETDTAE